MSKKAAQPPPDHLSPRTKELWTHHVSRGVVSPGRIALFQTALEALDRADMARETLEHQGMTFKTETTGAVHSHPLLRVERDARGQFASIWKALGLDYGLEDSRPWQV